MESLGPFELLIMAVGVAALLVLIGAIPFLLARNLITGRPPWTGVGVWLFYPLIATVMIVGFGGFYFYAGSRGFERQLRMRILSAVICLFVGTYALYVTKKHWSYVSQLPDSVGNRKIKRQQRMFLVVGLLFLLAAAWNFWLLASSN